MLPLLLQLTLAAPPPPTDTPSDPGRSTYVAKCQACHGPEGKGDGPAARALPKPPPDFTTSAFWKDQSPAALRGIIANGRPGTAMRGFPMSDEQLTQLVTYLQTLRPAP